jgi:hypothetical protein
VLLASYGRSKWEKLDSRLNFPNIQINERPLVLLGRLNTLKPQSLEELYTAILLQVLPDRYRKHFSRCQFKTAEELAAGLWEMRGGNPAVVVAVGHSASPGQQQSPHRQQQQHHCGNGDGINRHGQTINGSRGGYGGGSGRRDRSPTPVGALQNDGAPAPMVAAAGAASTTALTWEQGSVSQLWLLRHQIQAAMPLLSGKRGSRRRQLVSSPSAAAAVEGSNRLHPTTKLPIPALNTIHTFSAQSKLCCVRDRLSGKDFLVDTGATLFLLLHQSAAVATGPKLQSNH